MCPTASADECAPVNTCPDIAFDDLGIIGHNLGGGAHEAWVYVENTDQYFSSPGCSCLITVSNAQDDDCSFDSYKHRFWMPGLEIGDTRNGIIQFQVVEDHGCDHYNCMSVCLDYLDTVDEDVEENDYDNVNDIPMGVYGAGVTPVAHGAVVLPCLGGTVTLPNDVSFADIQADFYLEPPQITINPGDLATIDLYYTPWSEDSSGIIVVESCGVSGMVLTETDTFILDPAYAACCFSDGSCQNL